MPSPMILAQSGLFVSGVYLEKYLRKSFCSASTRKAMKLHSRILTCSILTLLIMLQTSFRECAALPFTGCFYLSVNWMGILHCVMANTLLFSTHIWTHLSSLDQDSWSLKSVLVAPVLEELLFRACFWRNSKQIVFSAMVFAVSHTHKPIWKYMRGKETRWGRSAAQIVFTFLFSCYSFYFLNTFHSVLPSIVLHGYCNYLGPPQINKRNAHWHLVSILAFILYCTFVM